jgi:hypothetical protein
MDHYCPSVANTIGEGNSRYFLQFLVWSTVSLLYTSISTVKFLFVDEFADYLSSVQITR